MSEIQKHIESCRSEDPLAQTMEACGNESALQAALQPLLVETMQGYEPVATTAPTSPIAELPNVLISIIRRVATKPLAILGERPAKQSLLGTLLDTWNAIRQRLSGNPSAGIPDRTTEMSGHSLPTALALLSDRKITGVPEAADGMSLVHLLAETATANAVTELVDDNYGWTCNKSNILQTLMGIFDSARTFTLGCKKVTASLVGEFNNNSREYNIHFPWLTELSDLRLIADEYENRNPTFNVYVESLRHTNQTSNTYASFFCKRLYAPVYESGVFRQGGSGSSGYTYMRYMLFGCTGAKNTLVRIWSYTNNNGVTDFEIGDKEYIDAGKTPRWVPCQSLTLTGFGNLTAENMYNHILCRLKQDEPNCGSGVTITLGTTNIEKLEAVDEYNTKLTELEDTYGYTFA